MCHLLSVFVNKLLFSLFFTSIVINLYILAANETEINEVLNMSPIDDNSDNSGISDDIFGSIDTTIDKNDRNFFDVLFNSESNESIDSTDGSDGDNSTSLAETVDKINNTIEYKVNCTPVHTLSDDNQTSEVVSELILVNSSMMTEYLESKPNVSQTTGAKCVVVIFYYKWCPFTAKTAKHFNALARIYPQLQVLAIDAYGLNSVNMRYGLVGVPTALFFHNGKAIGKVNDSEPTVEGFVSYINQLTGLSPLFPINITDEDLLGPLSSTPEPRFDYLLLFSWVFCIFCFSYLFAKSNVFKTTIETVRNNWREAEAQHEHID